MSKLVIGLTGGIGSGKTTVADIFAEYGIDIIDADLVAREAVEPGTPALVKIAEHFGPDFILADGHLDRSKLRHRVFANEADKTWLNALLHPLIRNTMTEQCSLAKSPYCFLVAPLLIENGINNTVDKVLVVDVKPETQITRTVNRDNNTAEQAQKILEAQISRDERLAHANYVINNDDCSIDELKEQIELLHREFLKLVVG
ncbi:dephospho-CoA kinase [Thalassotalea psychrophila]|uniref:Dephospho-CoA kinase n=1 Tax=Thalassotalea psychrophila TaxID=3065647 RepID=A0ABY9TWU6_9GAMM|nr:dephospho-CoA kinase [Colwelliaceae bacterium SQ149]